MLGGASLALMVWLGTIFANWLFHRNEENKTIRKYERLRAKVDVLSRLISIDADALLADRLKELTKKELANVLEELEYEEERQIVEIKKVNMRKLVQPFTFPEPVGKLTLIIKYIYRISVFLLLAFSFFMIFAMWFTPDDSNLGFMGKIFCVIMFNLPFVINAAVWLKLGKWLCKRHSDVNLHQPLK